MIDFPLTGFLAVVFTAAVIGALPPFVWRWSDRQLHLFIAFGAGVFLGAVFFHLLPELGRQNPGQVTSFMILNGFMVVLFVERVLVRHRDHDCDDRAEHRHQVVGVSAFVGLSLHSLMAGFSLGAGLDEPRVALIILLAIVSHKSVAAFSLATVFRLSNMSRRRSLILLILFACSTPLGALLALPLVDALSDLHIAIPTALATGSFIYVATMDLLPEAFHDAPNRMRAFIALSSGILIMMLLGWLGG